MSFTSAFLKKRLATVRSYCCIFQSVIVSVGQKWTPVKGPLLSCKRECHGDDLHGEDRDQTAPNGGRDAWRTMVMFTTLTDEPEDCAAPLGLNSEA